MKETLISFETAVLAKEKGFKEVTHSFYFEDGEFKENELTGTNGYYGEEYCFNLAEFYENWNSEWVTKKNMDRCFGCNKSRGYFETYSAPTQGLLQKWLREVHNIYLTVIPVGGSGYELRYWYYSILGVNCKDGQHGINRFQTYEEALEVGLLKALKLVK